jgi:uncharacterized protein (TIGR02145 family)
MTLLRVLLAGSLSVSVCLLQCNGTVPGVINDADGNEYHTVKIGGQVWTAENLRTTRYNDGSPIPLVTDSSRWNSLTTPAYCYYANTSNADSIKLFGALYNWYAVNTKKLAPKGWHVPDTSDWKKLQDFLIKNGYNWDGKTSGNRVAKSLAAKTGWIVPHSDTGYAGLIQNNLAINNKSGFSALPGGQRSRQQDFRHLGYNGFWWSASEDSALYAYDRCLSYQEDDLVKSNHYKSNGQSVRLIRD